jgi:Bacterial mobilisation protein (MobC)
MKTTANRSRRLTIRLTIDESEEIELKAQIAGLLISEYVRKNALGRQLKKIQVPAINQQIYSELVLMRGELQKQGTNINQIARLAHSQKFLSLDALRSILELTSAIESFQTELTAFQSKVMGNNDRED